MSWGAGPVVATAVAIVGAAAIAVNPIVPPPPDIRVSPSDLTADGHPMDVLDPDFLKKVGAGGGWPNPLQMLDGVVSGWITDGSDDEPRHTIDDLLSAANPPAGVGGRAGQPIYDVWVPPADNGSGSENLGLAPIPDMSGELTGPIADLVAGLPTPQQAIIDVVETLVTIGTEFGEAGRAFIDQLGAATGFTGAVEVFSGLGERLRELVMLPFTLATARDSNRIDRLEFFWQRSIEFVRAVIDSLIRLLPVSVRPPEQGVSSEPRGVGKSAVRDAGTVETPAGPPAPAGFTRTVETPGVPAKGGEDASSSLPRDVGDDAAQPRDEVSPDPATADASDEAVTDASATLIIEDPEGTTPPSAAAGPPVKSTKPAGTVSGPSTGTQIQRGVTRPGLAGSLSAGDDDAGSDRAAGTQ